MIETCKDILPNGRCRHGDIVCPDTFKVCPGKCPFSDKYDPSLD